jgi:hypothetical protein
MGIRGQGDTDRGGQGEVKRDAFDIQRLSKIEKLNYSL